MVNKDFKQLTKQEQDLILAEMFDAVYWAQHDADSEYDHIYGDWPNEERDSIIEDMTRELALEYFDDSKFEHWYSDDILYDACDIIMRIHG